MRKLEENSGPHGLLLKARAQTHTQVHTHAYTLPRPALGRRLQGHIIPRLIRLGLIHALAAKASGSNFPLPPLRGCCGLEQGQGLRGLNSQGKGSWLSRCTGRGGLCFSRAESHLRLHSASSGLRCSPMDGGIRVAGKGQAQR